MENREREIERERERQRDWKATQRVLEAQAYRGAYGGSPF